MHTILKNTIISILCFLSIQSYAQAQNLKATNITEWIILADNTQAYLDKELSIEKSSASFKHNDKVFGILIKDSVNTPRKWIIEVLEGSEKIYFALPALVENVMIKNPMDYVIGKETVDINYPLPINYKPEDLQIIDQEWNYHAKDYSKYLRKEVIVELVKMLEAAQSENIHLRIVSAFRNFDKQRRIYLRAISKKGIYQIGTAKPAHSEHQLGTTIDINSLNRKDMLSKSFDQTPEGRWLNENAHKFGFIQSYTKENSITEGYMPEPWHYRYLGIK